MRVMLSCPYSLTLFGGVQGQVLGLARAPAGARRRRPHHRPLRRPTARAGDHHRRAEHPRAEQRLGGADRRRSRRSPGARIEAMRTFRPRRAPPPRAVLAGPEPRRAGGHDPARRRHVPFGPRRAQRLVRDASARRCRPMMRRLRGPTAVSEEAQAPGELTFGGECEIVPNGVDSPSSRDGAGDAGAHARHPVRRPARARGRASRCCSTRSPELDRDADLWVDRRRPQTAALRGRGVPRVEWLGRVSEEEKQARLRGATIACFPALDGESFGVVLLEAMAAGTAVVASDIDGYRDRVPRPTRRRSWSHRATPTRSAPGCRGCSTTRRGGRSWSPRAARGPTSSRWPHVAERFLPLYERADRRRARAGVVPEGGPMIGVAPDT